MVFFEESSFECRCACGRFESTESYRAKHGTLHNRMSHPGRHGLRRDATGQCGTVSWKALDRATESDVGSPTTKFILHLLANTADENFSCYPSIRTLMAESGAGRSTVMRALKELEASGLIARQPQFHDSGARRSSRYYLNHPLAPHCLPRPDPEPPVPIRNRPLFQGETGGTVRWTERIYSPQEGMPGDVAAWPSEP